MARELRNWTERINAITLRSSKIEFIPVAVREVPEEYNRTIFCGYKPYRNGYDTAASEPVEPLIIRGKALPELTAQPKWYPHLGKFEVWFRSADYGTVLTDGQTKILKEWFEAQLLRATSEDLLATVRGRLIAQARKTMAEYTATQRKHCDEIDEAVGTAL